MDVINEIEVLENDVKDCNEKCQRVNCSAIYDSDVSEVVQKGCKTIRAYNYISGLYAL